MTNKRIVKRDPQGTRRRILKAARALFSEQGFHGTSIGAIAKRAGVFPGLIHHHFGSKKALWDAVLSEVQYESLEAIKPFLEQKPTREGLRAGLAARLRFFGEHPDVIRLRQWSLLQGTPLPATPQDESAVAAVDFFAKGQAAGAFRSDVPPAQLMLVMAGVTLAWAQSRHTRMPHPVAQVVEEDLIETLVTLASRSTP
ncbi:MAG: TetR/AcrR family transcriptional regulator [Acidobacteria bacterium]|nr:TetR/AcrR family transcriptional regulator [Acidobacteriota bacterium]